jgi:hypothetical protein
MTARKSPTRWATDITRILNQVKGPDHFPINVGQVAKEYSLQAFPDDPIVEVHGDDLKGLEGAMLPVSNKGWAIIYNSNNPSKGRINFTMAHEFGHYLLHRHEKPQGIQCKYQRGSLGKKARALEKEADRFASNLLMPLDNFKDRISPTETVDLGILSSAADHYEVSLTAAIRRWLEYTEKRAVMVVSEEGAISWSRASGPAARTGAYFPITDEMVEVPKDSLAANPSQIEDTRTGLIVPNGTWFPKEEGVREMVMVSEQYGFTISLLILSNYSGDAYDDLELNQDHFSQLLESRA